MDKRIAFIQGLRDLANFLEIHPSVRAPAYTNLNVFVTNKAEIVEQARAASWEKIHNGPWFYLRRTFAGEIQFDVTIERETVCRKVVTGTTIIPAQPERIAEEVEWVCEDSLLESSSTT